MKISHAILAAAAAIAAAGCGSEKCPTENPEVSAMPASCAASPGATVGYPLKLCPTCNQTGITCDVDTSGVGVGSGTIFLDPKAEVCESSSSCPPSCSTQDTVCTFTAPSAQGSYTVSVYNPGSGQTETAPLQVTPGGGSCAIASL